MWELFSRISVLWVFLGIGAVGFLFLLTSLVFGEIFEHFGGDFDHGLDHGGPGVLSPRVLSVFVTAFGGVGAIGIQQGLGTVMSSVLGVASGGVLATLIYFFARFLYGQQASSTISSSDLVGRTAQVIVSIPPNDSGQVRCLVGETLIDKIARSKDGSAIPYNSLVTIEEVIGEVVIVHPITSAPSTTDTP